MRGFVVAGSTAAVLAACSAVCFAAEVSETEVRAADLQVYWEANIPLACGERLVGLYRTDEYVYACGDGGDLYAVLANSGEIRWGAPVTKPGHRILKPTHVGRQALVATSLGITLIDRMDGRRIGAISPRFAVGSPAVGAGKHIYCGGVNHRLYRFRAGDNIIDWEGSAKGPITDAPIIDGPSLLVAGRGGRIYCLGIAGKTPRPQWDFRTDGAILPGLFVDDKQVIAASEDRAVYAVDRIKGKEQWRERFHAPLRGTLRVTADTAFITVADRGFVALDRADGKPRWTVEQGVSFLAAGKKSVYVRDNTGGLLVVDLKTGTIRERVELGNLTLGAPEPKHEAVFVGSQDGHLICLMPTSVPYLRLADLRQPASRPAIATEADAPAGGSAEGAAPQANALPEDDLESKDKTTPMYGALQQ